MRDTKYQGDLQEREDGVDICPSCKQPLNREDNTHEDTHWINGAYYCKARNKND